VAARSGDVVVGATDGLLDNICDEQLERAVQVGTRLGFSAKNMADDVAGVAYEASRRTLMGKPDDITVVIAFVVHSDS
jgi:protein phosphatase PTC7